LTQGGALGVRLPWAILFRASSPSQPANRSVVAAPPFPPARLTSPQRRWRCFPFPNAAPKVAPQEGDNLGLEATIPL